MPGPEDSLAASSPSNSLDLGTAIGPQLAQQGSAGGFSHPLAGQQGNTGGFADPSDVEVALQEHPAPWEEEEHDILNYVQSKVCSTMCHTNLPYTLGTHARNTSLVLLLM